MKLLGLIYVYLINSFAFASELPFVDYPFAAQREILCDQGVQSSTGNSHTFSNTLYAVDLSTTKNSDPASIFASANGQVISFDKCTKQNTKCGAGFGNHIKILSNDGVMIFYAHLESVAVKTGDMVLAGQFIGVEGDTGWTGKNNRHLHYSVHQDWRVSGLEYYKKYLGSLPDSVPFRMNICQKKYSTCNNIPMDIRLLKCKRMTGQVERVDSF